MVNWLSVLQKHQQFGTPVALVTIVKTKGSTPRDVGTKMIVTEFDFYGTIGGGQFEDLVIAKAREILRTDQKPERVPYPLCLTANQCCGGFVEVFIETLNTGPQVILFGAGHVAQAIAEVLDGTPFRVHLVDSRQDWLDKAPGSVMKHLDSGLDFIKSWRHWNSEKTFAAIMTFDHDLDQNLVENLVEKEFRYLGLIGSETKWQRFQKRLLAKGLSAEKMLRVQSPMGLTIGGKTPKEVAISFAAKIIQIQNENIARATFPEASEKDWLQELT
jgi:xanthine dehydrogenase accessory factor